MDAVPDPFAEDPAPAQQDQGATTPLLPDEREGVLGDLEDLEVFEALLAPRGVRGLVVDCLDCHEVHVFGWALLRSNLRQLLDTGTTPVHEPACSPDVEQYVSWDYARGFADASLQG